MAASALTLTLAAPARAGDSAAAEALFREGKALMERREFGAACPKLEASLRADEATGTLLALAFCHESEGRLATAWSEYVEVAARSAREGRADREVGARDRAAQLEPRLSKLVVRVAPEAAALTDLVVERDRVPVSAGAFGVEVPVDGGRHVITARASGHLSFERTLTIANEGETAEVAVPPLSPQATSASAPVPAVPAASDGGPPPPAERASSPLPVVGLALAGVGGLGLGVGGFFGLRAASKNGDSEADCSGNVCGPLGTRDRRDAIDAGNLSTVFFVAGGALLAGGATLYLLGRTAKTSAHARALPGGGTITLERTF